MSRQNTSRQTGVVSLMVTLVMMIVITLLVLGFAEISRTEQRNSLDDQLSTQAYYAAESGINDVRAVMQSALAAGGSVQDKTICGNQGPYTLNNNVDVTHNVAYTCVLVDAAPTSLTYTVGYSSTIIPVVSSGAAFNSLTLKWSVPSGSPASSTGCYTNIASLNAYPVASGNGAWGCNYPVLRVDLLNAGAGLARSSWNANTSTIYLVPFDSTSVSNSVAFGAHGTAVPAQCTNANCTAMVTGLAGANYYMRLTTLYRTNSTLTLSAGGKSFVGAQAVIDATGKAQDVLRRVRVAVDLTDSNSHNVPSAAIISEDSACKRFGVTDTLFKVYDDLSAGSSSTYCTQQ